MKKVLIAILILTVYLNIGWALGTYYHNDIFKQGVTTQKPQTITQKSLCGGGEFFSICGGNTLLFDQVLMMFFWPFFLFIALLSWVIWLIFAGGVAKLLGIG